MTIRSAQALAALETPTGAPASRLDWRQDGLDWPNREHSAFVEARGLRWHVQCAGAGPVVVLVHGTGASTHSWRDLLPGLAGRYRVLAFDLPGHGFTSFPDPSRMTIEEMAAGAAAVLETMGLEPAAGIGHSAGAVVLAQMALEDAGSMPAILSVNGAFFPFGGLAGQLFSPLAHVLAAVPLVPAWFARLAGDRAAVQRLMDSTGSRVDDRGLALYQRLLRNPDHVRATLAMMARWDLDAFVRRLPSLAVPLLLAAAENDRTVPPEQAARVARMVPEGRLERLEGLGHLAHEEAPERIAELLDGFLEDISAGRLAPRRDAGTGAGPAAGRNGGSADAARDE